MTDNPPRWAQAAVIQVVPANGGQPKTLAASFDSQPGIAGWSADSKRIYFSEPKGTLSQIYSVDVAADRIEELKTPPAAYTAVELNSSGNTFGLVRHAPDTPGEIYVASLSD